jgi:DMSO/TMAO reductase YedYZ molybdopterin-dependent catalytic subunit
MDIREHLPSHPVPAADQQRAAQATLRIDGLVARPLDLGPADLGRLPRATLEEPFVCEEGWSVPRIRWAGTRLADLLALVEPLPSACYVRASSGAWVVPVPLSDVTHALICDELDGQPLSLEHGAPWRLVVSGGICYANVKWLKRLELTVEPGDYTAQRIALTRLEQARSGPN